VKHKFSAGMKYQGDTWMMNLSFMYLMYGVGVVLTRSRVVKVSLSLLFNTEGGRFEGYKGHQQTVYEQDLTGLYDMR
jgi:hypothetical protein